MRESGLDEFEAFALLSEWNQTHCQPPWDTKALIHKVRSVYKGD